MILDREVTAVVFTFNQEPYVAKCLESILAQDCVDKIQILLHDDASTDSTVSEAERILSSSSVPWRIIRQERNQYSEGIAFFLKTLLSVNSKYIALCDGDDFWLSADKISKQLEFMNENTEYSLCHHSFLPLLDKASKFLSPVPGGKQKTQSFQDDFLNGNFVGACTAFFRQSALRRVKDWSGFESLPVPDFPIWGKISEFGPVAYLPDIQSAYRIVTSSYSQKIGLAGLIDASDHVKAWLKLSKNYNFDDIRFSNKRRDQRREKIIRAFAGRISISVEQFWMTQDLLQKIRACFLPSRGK